MCKINLIELNSRPLFLNQFSGGGNRVVAVLQYVGIFNKVH